MEGTPFAVGYYEFDAEGKLIVKNGPQADGYFYLNGIKQTAYQLIKYNGDYYFINDGHKYAKNTKLYLSAQFIGDEQPPASNMRWFMMRDELLSSATNGEPALPKTARTHFIEA